MQATARITGLALSLAFATEGSAQSPMPTFRTQTRLSEIEVAVVDADGPVTGLRAGDFELVEDGTPQRVLFATEVRSEHTRESRTLVPQADGEVRGTNADQRHARAWAIIVDDSRIEGTLREGVKAALRAVLAGAPPQDLIALVPTSGRRAAAREFTHDRTDLARAVDALSFKTPIPPSRPAVRMSIDVDPTTPTMPVSPNLRRQSADDHLISSIGNTAIMLGRTRAPRRTILVISEGLRLPLSPELERTLEISGSVAGGPRQRIAELREALDKVHRGGVTLHVVNPLAFDQGHHVRTARLERETVDWQSGVVRVDDPRAAFAQMARRSGGAFVSDPSPEGATDRVLARTRHGYRLAWAPSREGADATLRRLRVRVARPGVDVRAPEAYATVTDPAFENTRRDKPLGVAVASVLPGADLVVSAHARALSPVRGKAAIEVRVQVHPADTYALPPTDRFEALAIAIDDRGRTRSTAGGREDTGATRTAPDLAGPVLRLEGLRPGRYQVRVAVRSVALDRVGSVLLDLRVPDR